MMLFIAILGKSKNFPGTAYIKKERNKEARRQKEL